MGDMKKKLSVKEDDYDISVEDFSDWIEALEEIEIARIKMRLTKIIGSTALISVLDGRMFPSWLTRAADLVVFSLLVKYPEGITKEELAKIADMKITSMGTYLTSKEKDIAEHLTKSENECYSILPSSLSWAIKQLESQKESEKKTKR